MSMKLVLLLSFILLYIPTALAVDGFSNFKFGDEPEEVTEKASGLCELGSLTKDTRWNWKSYLTCRNYKYRGIQTFLYFEFSEEELAKIFVISKEIKDYFLIRRPEFGLLLPLKAEARRAGAINLADRLAVRDKVFEIEPGYFMTNFFYDGVWEWELMYIKSGYAKNEKNLMEDQLDDEEDEGVKGWKEFDFEEDTVETVREKLEGQCKQIKLLISRASRNKRSLMCTEYLFVDKKVNVDFLFENLKLVRIEIPLEKEMYNDVLPKLKEKYGLPYTELGVNDLYYPYIDFPKANISLTHKIDPNDENNVILALRYVKEGYVDEEQLKLREAQKKPKVKSKKSKGTLILESI